MNIGWRDKALRRAVLLSLLLLAACGYCLYQFSQAQKSAQRLAALQGQARVIQQLQARSAAAAPAVARAQAFRIPIIALTESDAQMQVGLPPVPFESLLSWLAALQREHGIRVLALAVERAEQAPGIVQVSLLRVTTQPSM